MERRSRITIRFNDQEFDSLTEVAQMHDMSISEYIRSKIFDSNTNDTPIKEPNNKEYHSKMMRFTIQGNLLLKLLAKSSISEEQYKDALETTKRVLAEWGYE